MDIIINSIKNSVKFHEVKVFFILQYFDNLSVYQLNSLVDNYMDILNCRDYKKNPMLS